MKKRNSQIKRKEKIKKQLKTNERETRKEKQKKISKYKYIENHGIRHGVANKSKTTKTYKRKTRAICLKASTCERLSAYKHVLWVPNTQVLLDD